MSKGPQYLQFFGSDSMKRLHGCAIAELDRGAESPCARLARPLRRPQVGFGNPEASIVFLSPSPLDPASTSNEAFSEWLDQESSLEHHMTAETPQPYFRFVRAVLGEMRKRQGQPTGKRDVLELAFHTWAVHCATENPDLVTDAAFDQCTDRHLQSALASLRPAVIVAMGGPTARYFWWRARQTWNGWGPMTALHGTVLSTEVGGRAVSLVLSVHPFQRGIDLHPEVIGRALGDHLSGAAVEPSELRAA